MSNTLSVGSLSLAHLRRHWESFSPIALPEYSHKAVKKAAEVIAQCVQKDTPVYGVNTGFGRFAETSISSADLTRLQKNIILSHAVGTGPLLDDDSVRLIHLLKINALAQGFSGITPETLAALVALYNAGVIPCVPAKGSVGASGDLAPLAHLVAPLIAHGQARVGQKVLSGEEALAHAQLSPITLQPKEGLALLNGTQVSTGVGMSAFFEAENAFLSALLAGAMSVEAAGGNTQPFDARIHEVRRQVGQYAVARALNMLLADSPAQAHLDATSSRRVQDPYCLRCQPQVMGACWYVLHSAGEFFSQEANAVTDNPLVFPETGEILSGGNFHAEPVAIACDTLAVAIAEIGSLAERRVALLVDPNMSGLPAFLVKEGGINSGFMMAQVTAAALVSENKLLAHPASVDSIPTSAGQEDHVSMATLAACRLQTMVDNLVGIIAIELLSAAQGLELRRPLKSSSKVEQGWEIIRKEVPFYAEDRYFAPDIEAVKTLIKKGAFNSIMDECIKVPSH